MPPQAAVPIATALADMSVARNMAAVPPTPEQLLGAATAQPATPSLPAQAIAQPRPFAAPVMPVVHPQLQQVITAAQLSQSQAGQTFWLGVQPEDESVEWQQFLDFDAMVQRIRELDGKDVSVHVFYGVKFGITKKPRFMITPWGHVPLFTMPTLSQAQEEDGFLGERSDRNLPVPTAGGEERGEFMTDAEKQSVETPVEVESDDEDGDDETLGGEPPVVASAG